VEETNVKGLEDLIEVVVVAYRGEDAFAATSLANVLSLTRDCFRRDVASVAVGMGWSDRFLIEFSEQNMGDSAVDGFRCVLEDVGQTDVEAALTESDRRVEAGETMKSDVEWRNRCAGPEVSVLLFKNGDECGGHYGLRLARWIVSFGTDSYCGGGPVSFLF
jgi:hypothetical protein